MPARGPSYAPVQKPRFRQLRRLVEVASIEDHGHAHKTTNPLEVRLTELLPLGDQNQRIGTFGGSVGRIRQTQLA
ncbi:hypothetical protein D3C72_2534880 [compost metagenome]